MHSYHLLRKRGGEWNFLLLGMVCALLAAAPAAQAGQDMSNARYAMALAVLQQCGNQSALTQEKLSSPQSWQKHLPYLMAALHHIATVNSGNQAIALTIKHAVNLPKSTFLDTSPEPSLPRVAVLRNGLSTTHFLC
ncbi:MAG: hypothetical protein ABI210_08355 [Abditibacteriaceae bacterium]